VTTWTAAAQTENIGIAIIASDRRASGLLLGLFSSTPSEELIATLQTEDGEIEMTVPSWVQEVLTSYDSKTEAHSELDVAAALSSERAKHGDLSEQEWMPYIAEHSVFYFGEGREGESVWGTYFRPLVEMTQGQSIIRNPDLGQLDADAVAHWQERATKVKNPIMKARYADAAWDFAKAIANRQPDYQCALLAIDGYVEATDRHFYQWENQGVQWLIRALHLARSVGDTERIKKVVDAMFTFYQATLQPKLIGIWVFLFDNLYGEKKLISAAQEAQIINDLEAMLAKLSVVGDPNYFDPFGAQAAAERLARHYKRLADTANVERVLKTYGEAFKTLASGANSMLAMAWLQPVIERYEQEGMKAQAEQLRLMQIEKGKNIGSDLKHYSVEAKTTKQDYDDLVQKLLVKNDLAETIRKIGFYFVPSVDRARKTVEELKTVAPFLSMIPITMVDHTGRPLARIGPDDDGSEGRLLQHLAQTMGFYQPFLSYVLEEVIKQFKPTAEEILTVLFQSPLFLDSRRAILREGLSAYLSKDHLKSIHVLVPQIEEMLRTLLALMGIPPEKSVPRHPGITDVKNMNDALGTC
jgi:lysyl-tRNA synthetase, class I